MIFVFSFLVGILATFCRSLAEDCPPLPIVYLKNGTVTATESNSYRFTCDEGYFLIGPPLIRCRFGKWIPEKIPMCLRSEGYCNPPPSIPHAEIWGDDTAVGSVVMYSCNTGYRMLGNNKRTCERNLGWSGLTPACQAEEEPLQKIAQRLEKEFIQHVGSHSKDSRARHLDVASIRKGLDLVILIDRSSSVDPVDFQMGIEFVKFLLKEFSVKNVRNHFGTRAAVLTFGSEVDIVFNLDSGNITNPKTANVILDGLQAEGGATAMVPAMTTVFIDVAPLLRPEAKRALFLITDGEPNVGEDITPEDAAAQLKKMHDFEIFTVGIGKDINTDLLTRIASEPVGSHVFVLNNYSQLKDMISIIKTIPEEAPKPGPNRCGFIDETQNPTEYQRWPWLAVAYVSFPIPGDQDVNIDFKMSLCAGTLICNQWVVTAASCFYDVNKRDVLLSLQEVFVALGERNLLEIDPPQKNYYAKNVMTHPDFDPFDPMKNNLALIQLNEVVPLNYTYRPICLPETDMLIALHTDLSTNVSTAGWGSPLKDGLDAGINSATTNFILRTKSIPLAEEWECQQRLNGRPPNIFCAGIGEADCLGNIGSPIVAANPDTGIRQMLGVLTDKSDCNQGHSRFTDLRAYLPWIDKVTNDCQYRHKI